MQTIAHNSGPFMMRPCTRASFVEVVGIRFNAVQWFICWAVVGAAVGWVV